MLLTTVAMAYPKVDIPEERHNPTELNGVENARDLGGYPAANGKVIAHDVLFRSGNLHDAVPAEIEALHITKIIDLRTSIERATKKDVSVSGAKMVYISPLTIPNLFVMESDDWRTLLKAITSGIMETWDTNLYRQYIQDPKAIEATQKFFEEVLDSNGAPILWHCTAGKDRTGIMAMLLMAALGCKYKDIEAEFLNTNAFYQEKAKDQYDKFKWLGNAIASEFYKYEIVKVEWLEVSMEVMMRMTDETNPDAALQAYIRDVVHLTEDEINQLQEAYLEPVAEANSTLASAA